MSIPFNQFTNDATTRDDANHTIARGLNVGAWPAGAGGLGKQATQVNDINAFLLAAVGLPNDVTQQLQNIVAKWQTGNEAERRVVIDTYFENIAVMANMAATPRMSLEPTMAANGPGGGTGGVAYPLNAQIGNGRADYIWNDLFIGFPIWNGTVVVEAKSDIGGGADVGQWQLAATMATTRQLAWGNPRYLRGILTDGLQWRFYQLDCDTGILERTPALNAGVALHQIVIAELIYKFFTNYNTQADIWTTP